MTAVAPSASSSTPALLTRPFQWRVVSLLQLLLVLMTFGTTTLFAAWMSGVDVAQLPYALALRLLHGDLAGLARIAVAVALVGAPYAIAVMGFFLAHEMGHYIACRYYGVDCSRPFFIPAPPPLLFLGTLGAVIVIRSPIPHRRALFDIGVAGPLAGFVVTLLLLSVGLALTPPGGVPSHANFPDAVWGDSLLTWLLRTWLRPDLGAAAAMHPVFRAGWVGLLATAMNLIPAGQLDGGHAIYAWRRRWHRIAALMAGFFLIGLVGVSLFHWGTPSVWMVWAAVALLWGRRHPPVLDESGPQLDRARRWVLAITIAILILCFMPHPIVFTES